MNLPPRPIPLVAGFLGFTGVVLGAFGAHALKDTLTEHGTLSTWQTAVLYQLLHSVALLALAGRAPHFSLAGRISGCWIAGILLFSGSLYGLALGGPKVLGPLTPVGGMFLLAGWALVMIDAWKSAGKAI